MQVIREFIKTKESEENIYKRLNAWVRYPWGISDVEELTEELQKYPCLYEKGNKGYKERERERERDKKENAWRAIEQFLRVFLWNIVKPQFERSYIFLHCFR